MSGQERKFEKVSIFCVFPYGYFNIKSLWNISTEDEIKRLCRSPACLQVSLLIPEEELDSVRSFVDYSGRGGEKSSTSRERVAYLLSRHTFLHTITDCQTSQAAYSNGPGRVKEQRTRDDRRVFDDGRGWWFPHSAKFENRKILR